MKLIFGDRYGKQYLIDISDVHRVKQVQFTEENDKGFLYKCTDDDIDFKVVSDKRIANITETSVKDITEEEEEHRAKT